MKYTIYFNCPWAVVFDPEDDLYISDGVTYLGFLDIEGVGSRKAAEYYSEQEIDSWDDIEMIFKDIASVFVDGEEISVQEFMTALKEAYLKIE